MTLDSTSPESSACVRTRCRPRSRSPSWNQPSPPSARRSRARARSRPRAPSRARRRSSVGERVEDRVEVRRDVEPEHLDVVADVPDDRDVRGGTTSTRPRTTVRRRLRRRERRPSRGHQVERGCRRRGGDRGGLRRRVLDLRAKSGQRCRRHRGAKEGGVRKAERVRRAVSGRSDRNALVRDGVSERHQVAGVRPGRSESTTSTGPARSPEARPRPRSLPATGSGSTPRPQRAPERRPRSGRRSLPRRARPRASRRSSSRAAGLSPDGLAARAAVRNDNSDHAEEADRDRHPTDRAQTAVVVGELDIPDPGRPPADGRGARSRGSSLLDRAQEGRVVRHAEADIAIRHDADVRPHRGERFRDRRVDAAVHETERLQDVLRTGTCARTTSSVASSITSPYRRSKGDGGVPARLAAQV